MVESGGVMEKRRIVSGLVSAVRHVPCLCPVFFFGNRLCGSGAVRHLPARSGSGRFLRRCGKAGLDGDGL